MGDLHGVLAADKRQTHVMSLGDRPRLRHDATVVLPSFYTSFDLPNSDRIDTMRKNPRLFRLTAGVALTTLLWDMILPVLAIAQPAPPPLPQPYRTQPHRTQPDQAQADPPARVGRIAHIGGTVSFHNNGDTEWSPVSVNYPVSAGNTFWTEPAATTELEISGSRIVLAGTTEFDIATLDNGGLQAVAKQGEAYLNLRDLASNEVWSVQTPRGLVRIGTAGRYDIVVGSTEQPTLVTVLEGAAEVEGPGVSLHLTSGQTATISGGDSPSGSFAGTIGPALRDPFLTAILDSERPRPAPSEQIPAQVAVMPGGSDLAGYGNWAPAPEYGQIWYPPVSPDWVPYRDGHWAFVAPWGWTWIDDAPWGFAPFHYGRWIEVGGRWAWTPGTYVAAGPPVYAPALVTFIGIGAGVALGAALAAGSIGWVPLGPHEPFRPWYRASDRHVRAVNFYQVTNNNVTINNYVNRRAATAIPGSAMAASLPVRSVAQPVTAQQFAAARPILGQQPIRPTAATSGVTPAVARQFNLGPTAPGRSASGPVVRPPAIGPAATGVARPGSAFPARREPGNPAFPAVGGGPPLHPAGPTRVPRQTAPPVSQSADPGFARPGGVAPAVTRASPAMVPRAEPRPLPRVTTPSHSEPRPLPRVTTPSHSEPRPLPQVITPSRPEPPRITMPAPAPRLEPRHFAPPAATPRFEPPRFVPQASQSRPEPQRFSAPAPRPEPPHPAPAAREKRPGER